jgi:RNA polymerase sigma-70 factor, ECF subfamily
VGVTIEMHRADEELWQATTAGDDTAFTCLFDRHVRAVYNHAFRLTGSWTLAEDVTQETFLVAWRRRDAARLVEGSMLPWLLVVATNAARTQSRSTRRRLALLRRLPAPRPGVDTDLADEVAGRLDDQRRMAEILAAVRRLPRAEREAVALCLWSGVPYPDAAVALGISEVAVRSRVSRARARLARIVTEDTEEEQ